MRGEVTKRDGFSSMRGGTEGFQICPGAHRETTNSWSHVREWKDLWTARLGSVQRYVDKLRGRSLFTRSDD